MKQSFSISLLLVFALYLVPPHNPHTCFTHQGNRHHGDCFTPVEKSNSTGPEVHNSEYICYDLIKGSGNYLLSSKITLKSHASPLVTESKNTFKLVNYTGEQVKLPEARCNTGPPLPTVLKRGPPSA